MRDEWTARQSKTELGETIITILVLYKYPMFTFTNMGYSDLRAERES
jgi:hypothetical protein